ncbi:MAG: hypothetical protein Q9190_002579 [Brigantiaea leucoxantha]
MTMKPTSFLDLPGEIRNKIYRYLLPKRAVLRLTRLILLAGNAHHREEHRHLAILRANKQIYKEVRSLICELPLALYFPDSHAYLLPNEIQLLPIVPISEFRKFEIYIYTKEFNNDIEEDSFLCRIDRNNLRLSISSLCNTIDRYAKAVSEVEVNVGVFRKDFRATRETNVQGVKPLTLLRHLRPLGILRVRGKFRVKLPKVCDFTLCEEVARFCERVVMGEERSTMADLDKRLRRAGHSE